MIKDLLSRNGRNFRSIFDAVFGQAGSAGFNSFHHAVDFNLPLMKIRFVNPLFLRRPFLPKTGVDMADIMAILNTFSADFTFSHGINLSGLKARAFLKQV